MKRIILIHLLLGFMLLVVMPQSSAYADSKTELLEQALIQQLHATIYQSLQELYNEEYPQFDDVSIIHIESYITGKKPLIVEEERKASASGGATAFNVTVQVNAIHHEEFVQILLNNEDNSATYTVKEVSTRRMMD